MFASHCRRLRTTTLAAKERDAQLRRAAHALQRLQTSGLAAMAAGHAERQKEVRLALGPVLWERSQRSQNPEGGEPGRRRRRLAAGTCPVGALAEEPTGGEPGRRRRLAAGTCPVGALAEAVGAASAHVPYLPRMHVRTALVRAGLLLVPHTHKSRA